MTWHGYFALFWLHFRAPVHLDVELIIAQLVSGVVDIDFSVEWPRLTQAQQAQPPPQPQPQPLPLPLPPAHCHNHNHNDDDSDNDNNNKPNLGRLRFDRRGASTPL